MSLSRGNPEKPEKGYSPNVRMRALQISLASGYSPGKYPPRGLSDARQKMDMFLNIPQHTRSLVGGWGLISKENITKNLILGFKPRTRRAPLKKDHVDGYLDKLPHARIASPRTASANGQFDSFNASTHPGVRYNGLDATCKKTAFLFQG